MQYYSVKLCQVDDGVEQYPAIRIWYHRLFVQRDRLNKQQHLRLIGSRLNSIPGIKEVIVNHHARILLIVPETSGLPTTSLDHLLWIAEEAEQRLMRILPLPAQAFS